METIYIPNSEGNLEKVEVSEELAFVIDSFRREEESQLRQNRRYLDFYSCDISLFASNDNVEDKVMEHETIKAIFSAFDKLTGKEQKRIILYYYTNLTYRQIADYENSHFTSVRESINKGKIKLQKYLNKF